MSTRLHQMTVVERSYLGKCHRFVTLTMHKDGDKNMSFILWQDWKCSHGNSRVMYSVAGHTTPIVTVEHEIQALQQWLHCTRTNKHIFVIIFTNLYHNYAFFFNFTSLSGWKSGCKLVKIGLIIGDLKTKLIFSICSVLLSQFLL